MDTAKTIKVTAVVGTYRKGGAIDLVTEELLGAARERGAVTDTIYLIDEPIEFCTNCRACTQQEGDSRGKCVQKDGMEALLERIDAADALVVASPMNFYSMTAVTKRFLERLICEAYWPWGMAAPKFRNPHPRKPAVILATSAAPGFMARWQSGFLFLLRKLTRTLGGKPVGNLFVGLCSMKKQPRISERVKRKARTLGARLVERAER